MMPLNAVWIDSKKEFVDSLRGLLDQASNQSETGAAYKIQHLKDWTDSSTSAISWNQVDVVLTETEIAGTPVFEWIDQVRAKRVDIPIVLVSDRSDKDTFIKAIHHGVNGFVEKPVDVSYLKNLLERFRCNGFQLRMNEARKAIYSKNRWVDLTSTEYKIIETLRAAGRRLTRSELQMAVWPASSISENNLDTHLTNLKRKIPELSACLNVKRGLGYFLETKPQ
jgi:DNA-binding response OmpR family regulator